MCLKSNGCPYEWDDFLIGLDTPINGRVIRITDCDDYTRRYFEVSNSPDLATPSHHIPTLCLATYYWLAYLSLHWMSYFLLRFLLF